MKNILQNKKPISRMCRRTASAALAFASALLPAIAIQSAQAQTYKVLHTFASADGYQPAYAGLIQGTNGDLYGATQYGGVNSSGTVFKMTLAGTLTTLYNFCSPPIEGNCVLGLDPVSLVLGVNGDIYGISQAGGQPGAGIIFKTIPNGDTVPISTFLAPTSDGDNSSGAYPIGALAQGTNGFFYGVTNGGGASGQGVVFSCDLHFTGNGCNSTLVSFFCTEPNCTYGDYPVAGLVEGTDGNLYGTTEQGGADTFGGSTQFGGTVFQITPGGALTTLYSFCTLSGCTDGQAPTGALVQDANGNFYGTTAYGGTGTACRNPDPNINGCGTVFEITSTGMLTTLHNFCQKRGCADGQNPMAGLILGSDGNLYGTTYNGGSASAAHCSDNACGTIFEITPSGTLTTLYSFCVKGEGCPSGGGPLAPLVQHSNGDFYGGTTSGGNVNGDNGTLFRLSTGLVPFVKPLPTSGAVGVAVKILGTGLTGATSVTFNGTAAAFTVVSASEITTNVPAGATTGTVQVVAPGGTFVSNEAFRVN